VSEGSVLMADLIAAFYDRSIPEYAKGKLLDMGCGRAPLFGLYRDYAREIVRVDWGNTLHVSPHVDVIHDLNEPLPFPAESFDTIILSDVLEHLPRPERCWEDMNRVLATGGIVILNVPFLYWLHEEPFDFYRYTEHALRRFASQAGFDVLLLEPLGGASDVIVDILGKSMMGRRFGHIAIKAMRTLHVATKNMRHKKLSIGDKFPLAYGMVVKKKAP
jgi:SAM-dependent methyltransferase